jgi:predicted GH43/DUF377 family glycosyl hydrolase
MKLYTLLLGLALFIIGFIAYPFATAPRPSAPENFTRHGDPVLIPDLGWERTGVFEPTVMHDGELWRMWYGGGSGDTCAIGYAESIDGIAWSKHGDPVVGFGNGGVDGVACRNYVYKHGGTYYMLFADGLGANGESIYLATSADGIVWNAEPDPVLRPGTWDVSLATTCFWYEKDRSRWVVLYDSMNRNLVWETGLATGIDLRSLEKHPEPLRTLQVAAGGMYGGCSVHREGDIYRMWYHAAPNAGNLPTDIYEATSTDLVNWQRVRNDPVLRRAAWYEVDQVADASVVGTRLYYSGNDNVGFYEGWIALAYVR